MRVKELNNNTMGYDPFLIDALGIGKSKQTTSKDELKQITEKPTSWQKDILLTALDKIESSISVNITNVNNGILQTPPLENYQEALKELKNLVSKNFKEFASKAQSNLTPQDILYLFEDENNFVV